MKARIAGFGVLVGAVLGVLIAVGCGGSDGPALLLRQKQEGPRVNFAMDESDSQKKFSLDNMMEIYVDGSGYWTRGDLEPLDFQLTDSELEDLRALLKQLDLKTLDRRYAATGRSQEFTFSTTYGGESAVLGDPFFQLNDRHGDPQVTLLSKITDLISRAQERAGPTGTWVGQKAHRCANRSGPIAL